ncbi:MAG: MarR family transcriptional regulator [Candidatus Cloacimonetes bacterium]|nr:MarR family transcriptional regulator [Candidatus Cloacimonadota bacterium]
MKEEKRKSIGFYIAYLGRKNHAYFDVEFKKMGLTPGAPFILKQLYNKDGIRQQDICDNQHINKAGVTRILSKLIQAGLIRREPHPTDKRAYTIHLTPKAREMREDFFKIFTNWSAILTSDFTDAERADIQIVLERMVENVRHYGKEIHE